MLDDPEFTLKIIPIDKISISPLNVRTVKREKDLAELAKSIDKIGIQQPVVVIKKNGEYELIIGQRRFLASKLAGKEDIPAIIRQVSSEKETIIASFSENIHRLDLEYRDKMRVAEKLLTELGSVEEVAEILGVSNQTIRNYLGYTIVPDEIKNMVDKREISATTAIRIARNIPDEKKAIEIAKQIKETPRNEERQKIINVAKENPNEDIKKILEIVDKSKFRRMTMDLTPKIYDALMKASTEYRINTGEIALEALTTWLQNRGFLG